VIQPVDGQSMRSAAALFAVSMLAAVAVCACAASVPSAYPHSPSRTPPRQASRSDQSLGSKGCQRTFVPAFFSASSAWAQAIATRPVPYAMFLNINSGPGTAPDSHFQALVRQAQAAGIAVLGYSSTNYGQRPVAAVEADVRDYKAWYGVNGIFLDVIQGTPGELPYYRTLASYIRATVPNAIIWMNPGTFPDPGLMSVADVVMVFEGSYAQYVTEQVPGWARDYRPDQFANVIYATPPSELASAVRLSRARRAGYVFVTGLPGSPDPYDAMPGNWAQEAAAVAGPC
jgi:Spherulation-specific family 4